MFLQTCSRVLGYPKIYNFGYLVPEITENAQPYIGQSTRFSLLHVQVGCVLY